MACSSCSSPPGSQPPPPDCNGSNPIAPPRVGSPPVVPIVFSWAARLRSMFCGKLLVSNGEEIGALESAISGPVHFDAATQKVSVGYTPVTEAEDTFACSDENLHGFPAWGVTPECRSMGENPPRQFAFVRPPDSNFGHIFGVLNTFPKAPGLKPEMRPVRVVPADLPTEPVTGLFNLAYTDVPATDTQPKTRKWYGLPQQDANAVDLEKIQMTDAPEGPLTIANDADFGFAGWVKNESGTKYDLKKITNASMQALIGLAVTSPFKFVRPRPSLFSQIIFGPNPFTPVNVNLNLTTVANYDASYTAVQVTIKLAAFTVNRSYDLYALIDGEEFARTKNGNPNGGDSMVNTVIVPIPSSKQLNFQVLESVFAGGTYATTGVDFLVDAFVK